MAIKNKYQKFGISFSDAYTKISTIEYSNGTQEEYVLYEDIDAAPEKVYKKVLRVQFQHQTFPFDGSTDMIDNKTHYIILNSADDIFEECYNYLKSLPEFSDAVDC